MRIDMEVNLVEQPCPIKINAHATSIPVRYQYSNAQQKQYVQYSLSNSICTRNLWCFVQGV